MDSVFIDWIHRFFGRPPVNAPAETDWAVIEHNLPFERVETTNANALATWEHLRGAGRGWPVIVGSKLDLDVLAEHKPIDERSPEAILTAAEAIDFPRNIRDLHERECGVSRHETLNEISSLQGKWPLRSPPPVKRLNFISDLRYRQSAKVHILLIPASSGPEVPAILRWGGWNACPSAEYQVAALRSWNARYGAELVGIGFDKITVRVSRRPATRLEAMNLALEQYFYCSDLLLDGTLSEVAARLHAQDWWGFWWD